MAYYLQMDGVDDYVKLPSMTFDKFIIDFTVRHNTNVQRSYFDFRTGFSFGYIVRTTGGVDSEGNDTPMTTYINGVGPKTNNTVMVPTAERCTMEVRWSTAATDDGNIFTNSGASANTFMPGDIYDIKFYSGATLVAHYDCTLGNVQDQSGNGRHATLTGGTWVEDGPVGTDGSTTYATRQTISNQSITAIATKQTIHNESAIAVATKQTVYSIGSAEAATRQTAYNQSSNVVATRQTIYAIGSVEFAIHQTISNQATAAFSTRQTLTATGLQAIATRQQHTQQGSLQLATRQIITWSSQTLTATHQTITTTASLAFAVKITIFDPGQTIIGTITLLGDFDLTDTLTGDFVILSTLSGDFDIYKTLKGGVDVTIVGQNITLRAGDSRNIDFVVPHDLTGALAIKWGMLNTVDDTAKLIYKTLGAGITIKSTSPTSSTFTVKLDPADTLNREPGVYYHEAKVTDSLGRVATPTTGSVTIKKSAV